MNQFTVATARLEAADDLASILYAAYDAFEFMLPVIEGQQDPASGAFTDFVMAAAYAADGRDALAFAPSLRAVALGETTVVTCSPSALAAATALAALSRLLADRLGTAAISAANPADRSACVAARRQASRIATMLGRAAGQ